MDCAGDGCAFLVAVAGCLCVVDVVETKVVTSETGTIYTIGVTSLVHAPSITLPV